MAVRFFSEDISYKFKNKRKKTSIVKKIIETEGFSCGKMNVIVCSDKYLLELNKKYLTKDNLTDIITFSFSEGKRISGDLYISIERIFDNAGDLLLDVENEFNRVIIHGVLHLCGYEDSGYENQKTMRQKEDFYLAGLI